MQRAAKEVAVIPRRARPAAASESGFTIIELSAALGLMAIVAVAMTSVFVTAVRTAGEAGHRTDASSIASREIEGMRAVPYSQVGFYSDQAPGYVSMFEGFNTVTLGALSPASGPNVPLIQPVTPDPNAAAGYAPDPNPANASPIVQGNVKYSVHRYAVWVNAQDSSTTYTEAYKRLTVLVTWTDVVGAHTVREDSLLYPGGQGKYQGPEGIPVTTTTSTTAAVGPGQPVLTAAVPADPAGETAVNLTWTQPAGAPVTSYVVEWSTNPSFPAGSSTATPPQPPSVTSFTATPLTPDTKYYFEVIASSGAISSTSQWVAAQTLPVLVPTCTLGPLQVQGATSLSTTGSILQNNGKMSENLTLSWTTTGTCSDSYNVQAVDPNSAADQGSPYGLTNSAGSYSGSVLAFGQKGWAIGLHTFTVWDLTQNQATSVVKTFKVCKNGVASC